MCENSPSERLHMITFPVSICHGPKNPNILFTVTIYCKHFKMADNLIRVNLFGECDSVFESAINF